MTEKDYIELINFYFQKAKKQLIAWLEGSIELSADEKDADTMNNYILSKLPSDKKKAARNKGYSKPEDYPLSYLLIVASRSTKLLKPFVKLRSGDGDLFTEMSRIYNNWSRCRQTSEYAKPDIVRGNLITIRNFFRNICKDEALTNKIEEDIKAAANQIIENDSSKISDDSQKEAVDAEIVVGSLVRPVNNPSQIGSVTKICKIGNDIQYSVLVGNQVCTFYNQEIEIIPRVFIDTKTFDSLMTANQICNPTLHNLYSLNFGKIDFVPYQFRPVIKMLNSDEHRILIADGVGVGKTIESGIILKELDARSTLKNIAIICPKALISEHKWLSEMKRFDEDFVEMDSAKLRSAIKYSNDYGKWTDEYSRMIIPYSILTKDILEGNKENPLHQCVGLEALNDDNNAVRFDLVIIDEAHHIRHKDTLAYKCCKFFCDHADAVVLLTATPLQTDDEDLYTLLNLIRPDYFFDKNIFEEMCAPNLFVNNALKLVRNAGDNWAECAKAELEKAVNTEWGKKTIAVKYESAKELLNKPDPDIKDRVKLMSLIESMHSLNNIMNRTRRRDIEEHFLCERQAECHSVQFTDKQQKLYNGLIEFVEGALSEAYGSKSIPFMTTTIKRQASSCIFGLKPFVKDITDKQISRIDNFDSDYEDEDNEFDEDIDAAKNELEEMAGELLKIIEPLDLDEGDPKFDALMKIITEKNNYEKNKVMVFSSFRHTLSYLEQKLQKANVRVGKVTGAVPDEERRELRSRFELPKADENALDVLLFTEVGSEGLDYQFCDTMVNYDLPWNPMRIEQRIGRIDRRGQESEKVYIFNLITKGTIDETVYERCLSRIGIFERSIGDCDAIIGDYTNELNKIMMDGKISESKRSEKLEELEMNLVKNIHEQENMEKSQSELFSISVSDYANAQEIQRNENEWISPDKLRNMVELYLEKVCGAVGGRKKHIKEKKNDGLQLVLSVKEMNALYNDYKSRVPEKNADDPNSKMQAKSMKKWEKMINPKNPKKLEVKITFKSEEARSDDNVLYITPFHPLALIAADYIMEQSQNLSVSLQYASSELSEGKYLFKVMSLQYHGYKEYSRMVTVCENEAVEAVLPEILPHDISLGEKIEFDKDNPELAGRCYELFKAEEAAYKDRIKLDAEAKIQVLETARNQKLEKMKILHEEKNGSEEGYEARVKKANSEYDAKIEKINSLTAQSHINRTDIITGIIEIVEE